MRRFQYLSIACLLTITCLGLDSRADVFTNVGEAGGYDLVYSLNIPDSAKYNSNVSGSTAVNYAIDNALSAAGPFDRVAYYMELTNGSGTKWVYASMSAFTADPSMLGVPTRQSNTVYQRTVSNMNVYSSAGAGVTTGAGLAGNIEFWPNNYQQATGLSGIGGSGSVFDYNDNQSTGDYGSMQIHNYVAGETLMAYNRWGGGSAGNSDLGIGNQSTGNPDWTFAANAAGYSVKQLQVLVHPMTDITTKVAEAANYDLLYALNPASTTVAYNSAAIPYTVNNGATYGKPLDRVAYYMELQKATGELEYVWVSMDAFTRDAKLVGVPALTTGASFQMNVDNMNVVSNVTGVTTGTGLTGGNIEFWPNNYSRENAAGVPNASGTIYDTGDQITTGTPNGYGSMQIHNHDADETLFAFNSWGNGQIADLGIGNDPNTGRSNYNPDYTFSHNAPDYTIKNIYVFGTAATPEGPTKLIMPLGDSITYGSGTTNGGYRNRLELNLVNNLDNYNLLGSQTLNSSGMTDLDHEGHPGYRIDEIDDNLEANSGRSGNNGGYWLTGGGGTGRDPINPAFILLHIGTNDISQGATAEVAFARLQSLIDHLIALRPDANILLASLIPRNDARESISQAFNAMIPGLVTAHQHAGHNVYFVDMHSALTIADLGDAVHPNAAGYIKMGDAWFAAIQTIPEPSSLILLGLSLSFTLRRKVHHANRQWSETPFASVKT